IFSPYLLPKPWVAATTTEAQSVSGIKPIFRSVFSGASEPAAQALLRKKPGAARLRPVTPAIAMDCLRKWRRLLSSGISEFRSLMGVAPLLRAIKNGVPDGSSKEVGLTNAVVREAQPAAVGVL